MSRYNIRAFYKITGMCSLGLLLLPHTIRDQCDKGNCANRPPLPRCATSKGQPNRGEVNLDCICGPSLRARHVNSVSVPLWWNMDKASLKKVYIFQVLSCFLFFVFFKSFLWLCLSSSSSQNKFSSKIAIKSLWKFISIAAIWNKEKTFFKAYSHISSMRDKQIIIILKNTF